MKMEMDMDMATDLADRSVMLEHLSALADGELEDASVASACASWREDEELRQSWHSYQLIGDVLRSEDLGSDATHDAAFLNAIRTRLASEPVVLAPQLLSVPHPTAASRAAYSSSVGSSRRRPWTTSVAVAAGFMAVAGVLLLIRAPGPSPEVFARAGDVSRMPAEAGLEVAASVTTNPGALALPPDPQVLIASGKLIRDVRLDRYLAAHKQFAGSSALGVPSAFLRSATADASDR